MVKTETVLLVGGIGLAAAFALGLFGKPEGETPLGGITFPDFSFLSDLLAGGVGIPDLATSFLEPISQTLAGLQDQIGQIGTTIIAIPTDIVEDIGGFTEDITQDFTDLVGGFGTSISDFGGILIDFPFQVAGGIGEKAVSLIPAFNPAAGLLTAGIAGLAGLPFGVIGAIPAAIGGFAVGGFTAIPLSEQIRIAGPGTRPPVRMPAAIPAIPFFERAKALTPPVSFGAGPSIRDLTVRLGGTTGGGRARAALTAARPTAEEVIKKSGLSTEALSRIGVVGGRVVRNLSVRL